MFLFSSSFSYSILCFLCLSLSAIFSRSYPPGSPFSTHSAIPHSGTSLIRITIAHPR
ncbi:uncharacterized protein ASCRUDRAFT_73615 [Ascoidea rubescens DSM 1968]|uniref:Secreted protein n=1 Tax=Ascoidea rubescens DSM 1968 TaxID=1344418 RepID=A0A1D2VQG8_9ASCO|nr:hypothetical protein ASCRUDRAFT_73615 [Ascoidea rubescens DSM 1968]ODV63854.1 hypothetical protein ASCRUDRAFT_73615 [Ascoidea rubescens DSM 1968]